MELGDETPRPVRLRADRNNPLAQGAMVLAALVGLGGLIFFLGVAATRQFGTGHPGYVTSQASGVAYKYKVNGTFVTGNTINWDKDALKAVNPHTPVTIYQSALSRLMPSTAVVANADGNPGGLLFSLELSGFGLLCLTLLWPLGSFLPKYRMQKALVRDGAVVDGFIIRHQPFDRRQRGQALHVWFEYTPQGEEDPINARMQVDKKTYRQLTNRQPVKVFHGRDPQHAIMYDACNFEVLGDDGQAARTAYEKEVAAIRKEALPGSLEYKYGFGLGSVWLRYLKYVQVGMIMFFLATPFWGFSGYSHVKTPECSLSLFGFVYLAPWLAQILFCILVVYAILEGVARWKRAQLDEEHYIEPENKLEILEPYSPDDIGDPLKTALHSSIDRSIWKEKDGF